MQRGPKPEPAALRLVKGNPGRRPIPEEPQLDADGEEAPLPPAFLSKEAVEEWNRIVGRLHSTGLMSHADVAALSAYCQAFGRWRQAEEAYKVFSEQDDTPGDSLIIKAASGNTVKNPLVAIANEAMADCIRYATEFGMTPSARMRVSKPAASKGKGSSGQSKPKAKGIDKYFA